MKSSSQTVHASFHTRIGPIPLLLKLAQRQFEKSIPTQREGQPSTFVVPLDLIRLAAGDPSLTVGIKGMSMTYRKGGK